MIKFIKSLFGLGGEEVTKVVTDEGAIDVPAKKPAAKKAAPAKKKAPAKKTTKKAPAKKPATKKAPAKKGRPAKKKD
jgi:trigger factor